MISSLYFQICSLFYIILLICVFFFKKRINLLENKVYRILIISNLFGLILDISSIFTIIYKDMYPILNFFVTKLYLVYLLTWIFVFTLYIYIISTKPTKNNQKNIDSNENLIKYLVNHKLFISIYLIILSLIFMLPLYYVNDGNAIYSYGPSANLLYIVSGICILFWIICMIKNFQNIKRIKCVPIFAYMIIGVVVIIIQGSNPSLLLMTAMETFVTFLMYFTIENPDLKLIRELNIARDQAEKANNAKSDFLSNMSHEIRTPLNAIVGFSQALEEEDIPPSAKEEVKDIMMASQSLLEIVNGILDISKIEANKLEIVNTEYMPSKIFDELCILTKARIGDKAITFKSHYDESIPKVLYGDHTRLKQVVLNLLTNAAKYTKEGFVEFKIDSVIKDGICRLIISVEDSGIGIKPENIDKLFTKFERFDLEKNITIEGTGLGLAITKKLVELMNGKIVVSSVYGEGSKFTVAIDQKVVENPTIQIDESASKTEVFDASNKRILVVDDNKINLKVAARLLKDYNVVPDQVLSGFECLDKINNGEHYDLILMDDMMPKMSGTETIKKLKEIEGYNIPTVALTANAIAGMKEKYLNAGFDDYLSKPIDKIELNTIMVKYLKK